MVYQEKAHHSRYRQYKDIMNLRLMLHAGSSYQDSNGQYQNRQERKPPPFGNLFLIFSIQITDADEENAPYFTRTTLYDIGYRQSEDALEHAKKISTQGYGYDYGIFIFK